MKKLLLLCGLAALLAIIYSAGLMRCTSSDTAHSDLPPPTEIKWDMEEGNKGAERRAWFAQLHQAAPDIDWKAIEYKTAMAKHQAKAAQRELPQLRSGEETFANGKVIGSWEERGSTTQAGSVIAASFDSSTDELYTIGAGGPLYKRSRTENNWELLNDDLRFDQLPLHTVRTDNDDLHVIAAIDGQPHISLDGGRSWAAAEGVSTDDSGGSVRASAVIEQFGQTHILLLQKSSSNSRYRLYLSTDFGQNYREIARTSTSQDRGIDMDYLKFSNQGPYIVERNAGGDATISEYNFDMQSVEEISDASPINYGGFGRVNIEATIEEGNTLLYAYDDSYIVYRSLDKGLTWEERGIIMDPNNSDPTAPWRVGLFSPETAPNVLLAGAVEALRSIDGGSNFSMINQWWEYYSDPKRKLHADMMWMDEFLTSAGEPFVIINNHGGMYISYNNTGRVENISLEGLNVSQYYDVRSFPDDHNVVFAGAQDQGFQRAVFEGEGPQPFEQVISGDYGHIEFTDGGQRLWTVYPNGLVHYYRDPEFEGVTTSYTVNSDDEGVWIVPLMPDPDPEEDVVYITGGSATGGPGRYIIKLEYKSGSIRASNLPYNFDNDDAGNLTAMEVDPSDPNIWYVATGNGKVYKSTDRGQSFERLSSNIPGGHYLYGADIVVSKNNPDLVLVSGSGYSTPGVRISENGGDNWKSMITGLPRTMVFAMAFNDDESLLYAATEAGPYVCVMEEKKWYDLSGLETPNQTYWSIEYLEEENVMRYGTYGRGIWDFNINKESVSVEETPSIVEASVFPNPSTDYIQVDADDIDGATYTIYDMRGQAVQTGSYQGRIDVSNQNTGTYILNIKNMRKSYTARFVVH